jgi:hypothetical protein
VDAIEPAKLAVHVGVVVVAGGDSVVEVEHADSAWMAPRGRLEH